MPSLHDGCKGLLAAAFVTSPHDARNTHSMHHANSLPSESSLSSLRPRCCRPQRQPITELFQSVTSVSEDDGDDELFLERFRRRRQISRYRASARSQLLPPSPQFTEVEFIQSVLEALRNDNDGYSKAEELDNVQALSPDSGPYVLLRSSTAEWFDIIRRFVGVVPYSCTDMGDDDYVAEVASALASSFSRSNNQFHVLTGQEPAPKYVATFPTDPVEQDEETSWLECRLRDATTDELLVVSGWDLKRREGDGAWLIDGLDWQDFRDGFRPGIGREEWERICG